MQVKCYKFTVLCFCWFAVLISPSFCCVMINSYHPNLNLVNTQTTPLFPDHFGVNSNRHQFESYPEYYIDIYSIGLALHAKTETLLARNREGLRDGMCASHVSNIDHRYDCWSCHHFTKPLRRQQLTKSLTVLRCLLSG